MAKRKLGQVGFRDRGKYNKTFVYKRWDMVTLEGSTFICSILEEASPIVNKSPNFYPELWKCIARGGVDGIDGIDGRDGAVITPPTTYGFIIRDGDLILIYPDDETPPNFYINDDGYLILKIEE